MIEKRANYITNLGAEIWTDPEKEVILNASSRQGAIADYRQKFPNSTRSPDAVGRRFYTVHTDKRSPNLPWADEEKEPILTADNIEGAIATYRDRFPKSTRSTSAIRREWWGLRPEKRGVIPCGRKKGGTNKAPLKGTAREKYLIPWSTKQNKKGYNHAVYICTKYDKPYAVAVELEVADLKIKERKMVERAAVKPVVKVKKIKVKKERTPRKTPVARPILKPHTPCRAPDPVIKTESEFTLGCEVIHNGSKSSPFFGRVGKIVQIVKTNTTEQLIIRFGSTNAIALSPKFVIPVSARTTAAAVGAS